MAVRSVRNSMLTPEQMADQLGVSRERVAELRAILKAPSPHDQIISLTKAIAAGKIQGKPAIRHTRTGRSVQALTGERRRLLNYLKRSDPRLYDKLTSKLGLRG